MSKDLVFIASGGRTGTTFFGEQVKTVIDDCWSEHEPDILAADWRKSLRRIGRFGLWHMVVGRLAGLSGLRPLGHFYLSGRITKEECVRALRRQRRGYHAAINEPLIVESSGRWWMFADCIADIWPDAKMIAVIRDPRDWIDSWRRHQPRRFAPHFLRWFPLGPLTPADVGDEAWRDRWDALGQFGKTAWDWRTLYTRLDNAASENDRVRIFRFEDLFAAETGAMHALIDFIADHGARKYAVRNLSGFADNARNASHGPRRDWRDWTAEDARLLDEMCGPLMRKYGYGLEPEWLAMLERQDYSATSGAALHAVA